MVCLFLADHNGKKEGKICSGCGRYPCIWVGSHHIWVSKWWVLGFCMKPRRVSPLWRRKEVLFVFRRDMCVPENTSQPASVPKGRAQQAVKSNDGKGLPFSSEENTKTRRKNSRRAFAHMKRKRMKVWRKTDTRQSQIGGRQVELLAVRVASCPCLAFARLRPHVHYSAKTSKNPCSLLVKITTDFLGRYLISSNQGLILGRIYCMI